MTLVTKLPAFTWSKSSSVKIAGIGLCVRKASVAGVEGATSIVGYSTKLAGWPAMSVSLSR